MAHGIRIAVACCCLALAACGSTGKPSGATSAASGHPTRDIEFSQCMRTHGVPNFPDPTADGNLHIGSDVDTQSPAFKDAQKACGRFEPGGGAPPATRPSERAAALAFARCVRGHGVPQFPDPAFTSPRNARTVLVFPGMSFAINSSVNPKSPAFQQAAGACGLPRPTG